MVVAAGGRQLPQGAPTCTQRALAVHSGCTHALHSALHAPRRPLWPRALCPTLTLTRTLTRSAVPNPNPNPEPEQERCAEKGAWPPFPFMNGALELLSAPLVRYVGTAPEVRARGK